MISQLKTNLELIHSEVMTKLLPENIKVGINILNVTGTYTSDATATAEDISYDKTAYINGEQVVGTLTNITGMEIPSTNISLSSKNNNILLSTEIPSTGKYTAKDNINIEITNNQMVNYLGLTADKIQAGNTILGITGTAPIIYNSVESMEAATSVVEDTLAIVITDNTYIGTYRYDNGNWTQLGQATSEQRAMNLLNSVLDESDQYEGLGGTEEEVNQVLDNILDEDQE